MKNKAHHNAFIISHRVMSKNTTPPQIVICDPGTVLHLCPRCSFTYLNDDVYWCFRMFDYILQCSTVIKKKKKTEKQRKAERTVAETPQLGTREYWDTSSSVQSLPLQKKSDDK